MRLVNIFNDTGQVVRYMSSCVAHSHYATDDQVIRTGALIL